MDLKITDVVAREILDCRGNPTVQVDVIVNNNIMGRADVPAGRSTGANEAYELRDGGKRFKGLVLSSSNNVLARSNQQSWNELNKSTHQALGLDGTQTKPDANAILGVFGGSASPAAGLIIPLYKYVNFNVHVFRS